MRRWWQGSCHTPPAPPSFTAEQKFKWTVPRDYLLLVFFRESSFPKPLIIALGSFNFFLKFAEIFAIQGALPVSTTPAANLPPLVHLKLRISQWLFEKVRNGPIEILWGWGKLIHKKNWNRKSGDTVHLKTMRTVFPPPRIFAPCSYLTICVNTFFMIQWVLMFSTVVEKTT